MPLPPLAAQPASTSTAASIPQSGPVFASQNLAPALINDDRAKDIENVLEGLRKLGYNGLSAADLSRLNPPDKYEEELSLMAEVRAYFKVSYKVNILSIITFRTLTPVSCSVSSTTFR